MLNKLQSLIKEVGLSFKREVIYFTTINVVMITAIILLVIFKVTNIIIFISAAFIPLVDYLFLSRYQNLKRKMLENRNNEFISLLSYFEIFISQHNNVYKSFEMLLPYSSDWMHSNIKKMLEEIDLDKSVVPYVRFAKNFSYLVIENVMVSIYQMVDQGESKERLTQFDYLFSSLNNTLMINKVDSHLKGIESLNAFPLIGAGIITITITLTIISLLGELTYVL